MTEHGPEPPLPVDEETPDPYRELRGYLIARRSEMGLSQRALAKLMGTAQSAVSDLENGDVMVPTADTLRKWGRALGVEIRVIVEVIEPRTRQFHLG